MAIANVQKTSVTGSFASPKTLAFGSNNTAGNLLIVAAMSGGGGALGTPTDSIGNAAYSAPQASVSVAGSGEFRVWYLANCKGGANTVSCSVASGNISEIHISEWSGVAAVTPIDKSINGTGSSTTPSSGSQTTTANGELIYGFCASATTAIVGSGFALVTDGGNGNICEFQIQASAGAIAATFTQATGAWGVTMATFKAAAVSGKLFHSSLLAGLGAGGPFFSNPLG